MKSRISWLQSKTGTRKFRNIAFLGILLLNLGIYFFTENNPITKHIQAREDASGFLHQYGQKFLYHYYYNGYFPLASLSDSLEYSQAAAERNIEEHGEDLIMEYFHWSRLGENAKIFAYLPNAWVRGSPKDPSLKLFNSIFFVLGMLCFYYGWHKSGFPLVGLLVTLLLNITPFFLYEIYSNQNIFGLLGAGFITVLGLLMPVLFGKENRKWIVVLSVVFLGVLIAFFSEIRNETSVVFASAVIMLICSSSQKLLLRVGYIGLLFLSFLSIRNMTRGYFDYKFDEASRLVAEQGGHVYTGGRISGHKFWHPVYCGLGDFGGDKGYEWNDKAAYVYAVPVLEEEYNLRVNYSGKLHTDDYYDEDSLYYIKFDEIPEYDNVVKEKVIRDIKADPFWYIGIVLQRIGRTLTQTIPFPYVGWLLLPALIIALKKKYRKWLVLMVASLPLSATAILIYSGKGATFNSMFPYVVIGFLLVLLLGRLKKGQSLTKE